MKQMQKWKKRKMMKFRKVFIIIISAFLVVLIFQLLFYFRFNKFSHYFSITCSIIHHSKTFPNDLFRELKHRELMGIPEVHRHRGGRVPAEHEAENPLDEIADEVQGGAFAADFMQADNVRMP